MKKYDNPQIDLLALTKDVITVSGTLDDDSINEGDNFANDIFERS